MLQDDESYALGTQALSRHLAALENPSKQRPLLRLHEGEPPLQEGRRRGSLVLSGEDRFQHSLRLGGRILLLGGGTMLPAISFEGLLHEEGIGGS